MDQQKGFFYELMHQSEDDARAKQIAVLERQTKRKLSSAYDSSAVQALEDQETIEKMYRSLKGSLNIETFDVNRLVILLTHVEELKKAQKILSAEYERLFGEPMPSL